MSYREVYACDVCGSEKKPDANGWLVYRTWSECFTLDHFSSLGAPEAPENVHLCGQRCAHTQLDRWLNDNLSATQLLYMEETCNAASK